MRITKIYISTKITKSHKYQSGSGEWGMEAELFEDEDPMKAYLALRNEVVKCANELCNEALENALEGRE